MSSRKSEIKQTIAYLQARRSGVEWAIDHDTESMRQYIRQTNKSLDEYGAELYKIEQQEQEEKNAAKAAKLAAKKARQLA